MRVAVAKGFDSRIPGLMAVAVRDPRDAAYRETQAQALRTLLRRHPWLSQDERLDIYQEIWARLLERESEEGFWPDNVEAYVVGAVEMRARHEARARATQRTDPTDPLQEVFSNGNGAPMDEQVHGELDAEGLRAVIARLTPRQRAISKLRFDWQLSPHEIASVMDLPIERCYAELKHICRTLRRESRRMQRGEHIPRYERLLYRYVAGIASQTERTEALSLLEHSSQARMIASAIRRQADGLGALLPAPVLASAPGEAPSRFAELLAGAKQQLADAGAQAKQHAASVSARVGETLPPMPRGGVATVLSLCAAAGGTAGTYCAVEGVDPIKPLVGVIAPEEEKPQAEPDPAAEPPPSPDTGLPPAPPSGVPPTPAQSGPQAAPEPAPAEPPPPPGPQSGDEFAPSGGGASTPPAPAPPPSGGGAAEFGP